MGDIEYSPNLKHVLSFISPIYDGPVSLSILEAIADQISFLDDLVIALKNQTFVGSADWALKYWEQEYGLGTDDNLSIHERRSKVISKIASRAPMSPLRLQNLLEVFCGRKNRVIENTGSYLFEVEIESKPDDRVLDWGSVREFINRCKPAYLSCRFLSTINDGVKVSIQTAVIPYEFAMSGHTTTGTYPDIAMATSLNAMDIDPIPRGQGYVMAYDLVGTLPDISTATQMDTVDTEIAHDEAGHVMAYETLGDISSGISPDIAMAADVQSEGASANVDTANYTVVYPVCGENE